MPGVLDPHLGLPRRALNMAVSPSQDEKAAGLINVATYDLESTREQKKK